MEADPPAPHGESFLGHIAPALWPVTCAAPGGGLETPSSVSEKAIHGFLLLELAKSKFWQVLEIMPNGNLA
jgi:hypothetical protein